MYGVTRSAAIAEMPPLECIRTALQSLPSVASVDYKHVEGGAVVTLSGLKRPAFTSDSFRYLGTDGSHVVGVLAIGMNYGQVLKLSDSLTQINVRPPQADIDATRPVMAEVEERVELSCGVVGLRTKILESCRGVSCKPIGEQRRQ